MIKRNSSSSLSRNSHDCIFPKISGCIVDCNSSNESLQSGQSKSAIDMEMKAWFDSALEDSTRRLGDKVNTVPIKIFHLPEDELLLSAEISQPSDEEFEKFCRHISSRSGYKSSFDK